MKRSLLCQAYICLLLFVFLFNYDLRAENDSVKTVRFEKGYKESHYGISFLYLEGTDYEAGLQYGHLLKNELKIMYEEFEDFKENFLDKEINYLPWYQRIFANLFGGMAFRHKINSYADRLSEDIKEQIRGAAEGSDLPESFFEEIQVLPDLYAKRCEGVLIKKGNHVYHGHNLDQPYPVSLISKYPVVVSYNIDGKIKYTNLSFAACFSITTAFNENGISFAENGNNNPKSFDYSNLGLYVEKNKFITETHGLKEVDSLMHAVTSTMPLIFSIGSSKEKQAAVYDFIGKTKGVTEVNNYQFIGNKTISAALGKKSESIYAGNFHETGREIKFAELIDTTRSDMVDEIIGILSNTDFYHYTGTVSTYIESLHNFETDQSVIFDLADSTVYFTYYPHFAAWNRWLKYNYITREVSVYKEADPKLSSPLVVKMNGIFSELEPCDWRDSSSVRTLVNNIINSNIENYFSLSLLSKTYLDYYKNPSEAAKYAQKLIDLYPDIITGYFQKGRAYEEQNQLKEALEQYQLALNCKINCEYSLAGTYEHLALANHSLGKKETASEFAAKALVIHYQYWIPEYLNEMIQKLERIKNKID
jgi:tetratricopeptide (TPR) repeat protein